ncbi:MAG: hypothetical protein H2069_10155 [Legionella sp.]|nr:hypothetical protein [Legionella sp.]
MRRITVLILGLSIVASSCLNASGIDALALLAKLAEQTHYLKEQLKAANALGDTATQTVTGIQSQIKQLEATQKLLGNGHWQLGNKYDNPVFKQWRDAGKNFEDFLKSPQSASALGVIAKRLAKDFQMGSSADSVFTPKVSPVQKALFKQSAQTALAAGAQSELSYEHVNDINQMLESLQAEIDKAPDHKALLEIIARAQIENAKLNALRIKSEAAALKLESLAAQQNVSDAKWAADFLNRRP